MRTDGAQLWIMNARDGYHRQQDRERGAFVVSVT